MLGALKTRINKHLGTSNKCYESDPQSNQETTGLVGIWLTSTLEFPLASMAKHGTVVK